jgi:RNA polymerase sigma factor (sigma-70 family)
MFNIKVTSGVFEVTKYKHTHNMVKIIDSNLLIRLKGSNINEPVQELYRSYFESVVYYLKGLGCREEDGQDLFQESILVFIEQVQQNKFRGESSIKTYITGIARNLYMNELRSSTRRTNRQELYAQENFEEAEPDAHHRMFSRENSKRLMELFEEIGVPCKNILTGYYFDNMPMKQLLLVTHYDNEQVLRNKKAKCMKHLKELITSNNEISELFKTYLSYVQ